MNGSVIQRNEVTSAETSARWFVVETNARQERTANSHLRRLGFTPYLPMRASASKRSDAAEATPLFPSYLFLHDPAERGWSEVRSAPGIRSVFLGASRPALAPQGLVHEIRGREVFGLVQLSQAKKSSVPMFRTGETLRIVAGSFQGFDALFECMADQRRAWLLLSFLGRETRVAVPTADLKKDA